jgi:hypothetical protein
LICVSHLINVFKKCVLKLLSKLKKSNELNFELKMFQPFKWAKYLSFKVLLLRLQIAIFFWNEKYKRLLNRQKKLIPLSLSCLPSDLELIQKLKCKKVVCAHSEQILSKILFTCIRFKPFVLWWQQCCCWIVLVVKALFSLMPFTETINRWSKSKNFDRV